jgi:glutamine synthetase type III
MSRAGIVAVVALTALAGCGGGGGGASSSSAACPLLTELARTGRSVEQADVSDPNTFADTLQAATTRYVETATKLRDAMPKHLQGDVQQMITAVRRERFADAVNARTKIDAYARANCKTTT